jgi:A/G-specific adenine glycosylase
MLPADRDGLESLPGIGRYTAGAIASIAFGLDEAALDGNIRRVLSRVFNLDLPARSPQGERQLWELACAHLPEGRAGDYNQAMMDLGATLCTPQKPACLLCPLNEPCEARRLGLQEERPILPVKKLTPHYTVTAAVIRRDGLVLIARRPPKGLLGGLWEFPGGKCEEGESLPDCLRREIREELGAEIEVGDEIGVFQHAYTHFKVTLHAFICFTLAGELAALEASQIRWVQVAELSSFPMGKIDRQISKRLEAASRACSRYCAAFRATALSRRMSATKPI